MKRKNIRQAVLLIIHKLKNYLIIHLSIDYIPKHKKYRKTKCIVIFQVAQTNKRKRKPITLMFSSKMTIINHPQKDKDKDRRIQVSKIHKIVRLISTKSLMKF